jgi:hypothetical protein
MSIPARLLELAQLEDRLVDERRLDELETLYAERDRLIAALPDRLPETEIVVLQRAVDLQRYAIERMRAARDEVASELGHVDRGRATLRAYSPAGAATAPTVDAAG